MQTIKYLKLWIYEAVITLKLEDKEPIPSPGQFYPKFKKPVFSCSATIYDTTGEICGAGQCWEEIDHLREQSLYKDLRRPKIKRARLSYHLNDLHAGTPRQEQRLKKHNIRNRAGNYEEVCGILKKHHLFKDHGREFGRGWNYWPIPEEDLARIRALFREIEEENAKK